MGYLAFAAFILGVIFGAGLTVEAYSHAAVAHHAAQYDPQTGNLKWLDGSDVP